ncbi:MAG: biotin--[acetyl-CoA-carboxylase] ligase [bacterium]
MTINFRVRHYPILTSTNDLLALEIEQGRERVWDVVVANWQISGQGRQSRSWVSPPGKGLLFSVLAPTIGTPERLGIISFMAGLAVAEGIARFLGAEGDLENAYITLKTPEGVPVAKRFWEVFSLKWPNDVLAEGKKISGVLSQGMQSSPERRYFIIGIGVNVRHREADFPASITYPATSLYLLNQTDCAPFNLLDPILNALSRRYQRLMNGEWGEVLEEWKKHDILLNKEVKIEEIARTTRGTAVDIADDGGLVILKPDGTRKVVYSAYVHLIT